MKLSNTPAAAVDGRNEWWLDVLSQAYKIHFKHDRITVIKFPAQG